MTKDDTITILRCANGFRVEPGPQYAAMTGPSQTRVFESRASLVAWMAEHFTATRKDGPGEDRS